MENLKRAINLLSAVVSTMDTISVVGIDNQDKFVGCANVIKNVANKLREMEKESEAPTVLQESGTAKELVQQEVLNG